MPVALDQSEEISSIQLVGAVNIACAAELKNLLLQSLASGADLRVDLERATSLDITALQLLWAAGRKAELTGTGFRLAGPPSEEILVAAADAGFEKFPVPL